MSNGMPVGLVCKRCGQTMGMVFTPVTSPLVAACNKCLGEVMKGKPATNEKEWREVLKKL
jgi:hypothetical protein